ncbi:MAG TPA: tRNA lysidine(34) synthetase TilS, partial [Candidatus Scatomorpha merdipullorum]|nr:tRNA lysidine(34) synthetase TilS [Candidatus Scatomorpha merdipullorum]
MMDRTDLSGLRVLCAVSGGADSVYLLHKCCELRAAKGLSVCAAHYNHCLRGEESERDERFVRALCEELGVELKAGRGDVAAYARENKLGIEEAARKLRYEFLERAADELGCEMILTAHNADDNAETMLMALARGAGPRGLAGIPPVRGRVARPMLDVTRAEIERYLAENGFEYVEDSTNASTDYTRNRIRKLVMPVLRE